MACRPQGAGPAAAPAAAPEREAAFRDTADEDGTLSLRERAAEVAPEIPTAYLETVERNTRLLPEEIGTAGIETLAQSGFYLVFLRSVFRTPYAGLLEIHVFGNETYRGAFSLTQEALLAEPPIHQFQDHAWLRLDVYAGHGMGAGGFSRRREIWYEITDPAFGEALSFTSSLSTGVPYPDVKTEYEAKIVDAGPRTDGDGREYDCLTLQWEERLEAGYGGPYDENTPLFLERGAVRYTYGKNRYTGGGNVFEEFQFWDRSDNNLVFAPGPRDESVITNDAYNDLSMYFGRGKRDLLFVYIDRIAELSRTGSERQKRWLHDFLGTFGELEKLHGMYEWDQSFAEETPPSFAVPSAP